MAGLLYYIPGGERSIDAAALCDRGLGYVFGGPEAGRSTVAGVQAGPFDMGPGVVLADSKHTSAGVGFHPERQTWRKIPGLAKPGAAVGMYTDARPTPSELVRDDGLSQSHPVRLRDGQEYFIPIAIKLPRATDIGDDGEWRIGEVINTHNTLWTLAQEWFDRIMGSLRRATDGDDDGREVAQFKFAELCDGALLALSANYRLGKAEVALLGLFDNNVAKEVLMALIDWPGLVAMADEKKTAGSAVVD